MMTKKRKKDPNDDEKAKFCFRGLLTKIDIQPSYSFKVSIMKALEILH